MLAPVALFVYNRLRHTRLTVEALLNNDLSSQTDLIIFSDAASSPEGEHDVARVRGYISNITGFKSITVHHQTHNKGLSRSITSGVSCVLEQYGKIIVLEDDLLTSRFFLTYMNSALDNYEQDDRIISIHGYIYPVSQKLPDAFFLRGSDCWGWATWSRGWKLYNPDGQSLLDQLRKRRLSYYFNLDGTFPYTKMLQDQILGKNDSWAVRWHASAFLANKLTLYPGYSLVNNIGNDGSGIHSENSSLHDVPLCDRPLSPVNVPVVESKEGRAAVIQYFRSRMSNSTRNHLSLFFASRPLFSRLKPFISDLFPPLLIRIVRRLTSPNQTPTTFFGPFDTWTHAKESSCGYDSPVILSRVLSSTLMVHSGQAAYERDSVVLPEIDYSWHVLAGLLSVAAQDSGSLSVLDFGGSLGTSFFQNRLFLSDLSSFHWSVVEQPHFVYAGQSHIKTNSLSFYLSIDDCLAEHNPNVVLLSSVLQYLDDPFSILDQLISSSINTIIVDRTPFSSSINDSIYVQTVPDSIYPASYPLRIFSLEKFLHHFTEEFTLLINRTMPEGSVLSRGLFTYNFMIFKRKT